MDSDRKQSERLLTYGEVGQMLGYSKGTVENKVADGDLPFTKIKLSERAVRFRRSEVLEWIDDRAAESDTSAA